MTLAMKTDPNGETAAQRPDSEGGPLDVAILFVDLVSSTEFASVMGLREYADYVESFYRLCVEQCRHFFEVFHGKRYRGDGWLELGRLLKQVGKIEDARGSLRQARRHGVSADEEALP